MAGLFAVIARDGPGSGPPRKAHLKAHLAHIERVLDRFAVAAPLTEDGDAFAGSLMVIYADGIDDARALVESDPYFRAGIWDKIEIYAVGPTAGAWVGGKSW